MTSKATLSAGMVLALFLVAGISQAAETSKPATVKPKPATASPTGGGAASASYARTIATDAEPAPQPATAEATGENPLYEPATGTTASPLHEAKIVAPAPDSSKSINEKGISGRPKPNR